MMIYKVACAVFCLITCVIQVPYNLARSSFPTDPTQREAQRQAPDHVAYEFLFHRMVNMETLAQQKEHEGKYADSLRNRIRNQFSLDDRQAEGLLFLAVDCLQKAEQLDQQAQRIIKEIRALYPKGSLVAKKAPAYPASLRELQEQRNQLFLTAREIVRQGLGDSHFALFDEQVKRMFDKDVRTERPPVSWFR